MYPNAVLEISVARSTKDEATKELEAEGRFDGLRLAAERSVLSPAFSPDRAAAIHAISNFFVAFERFRFFSLNAQIVPLLGDNPIFDHVYFRGRGTFNERWAKARRRYA